MRFLCELGLFAALAYWDLHAFDGVAGVLIGLGAPIAAIVLGVAALSTSLLNAATTSRM